MVAEYEDKADSSWDYYCADSYHSSLSLWWLQLFELVGSYVLGPLPLQSTWYSAFHYLVGICSPMVFWFTVFALCAIV